MSENEKLEGGWISISRYGMPASLNDDDIVDVKFYDGSIHNGKAGSFSWSGRCGDDRIIFYRKNIFANVGTDDLLARMKTMRQERDAAQDVFTKCNLQISEMMDEMNRRLTIYGGTNIQEVFNANKGPGKNR